MEIKKIVRKTGEIAMRFYEHVVNDIEKKREIYEAKYVAEERYAKEKSDEELIWQFNQSDGIKKKVAYYELASRGKTPKRKTEK